MRTKRSTARYRSHRFAQFWSASQNYSNNNGGRLDSSNQYSSSWGESSSSVIGPSITDRGDGIYRFKTFMCQEVWPTSRAVPKTRSGHRMVADEQGDLYSFGGFNLQVPTDETELSNEPNAHFKECNTLFQELWRFNCRSRSWTKIKTTGDIPDKLVSHCMCYWRGKIIIYGGTGLPYGRKSSNKITIYHIEQNRWEAIEPTSEPSRAPQEMYGQACVCDGERGEVYVVGGTDGSKYSLDVHKFNLYTRKWTPLYKSTGYDPGEPGLRYRHEIALYNNKLFIFGGSTNETFYGFKDLPVFDLETNDWTFVRTRPAINKDNKSIYPSKRKCHSLGIIGNDCYMAGGTNGASVCSDVWHINLEELKWTRLHQYIQYPVYFHAGAISLNSKLSIFGGVEDTGGRKRNNKLTQMWVKVPTLKEICLESVEFYAKGKQLDLKKCKQTGLDEAIQMANIRTIQ